MNYQFRPLYGNQQYTLQIELGKYATGNTRMQLIDCADGFPFATASVDHPSLAENEIAVKNWSENEGVLEFLLDNNIVEQPHRLISSGFVTIYVCMLKLENL